MPKGTRVTANEKCFHTIAGLNGTVGYSDETGAYVEFDNGKYVFLYFDEFSAIA